MKKGGRKQSHFDEIIHFNSNAIKEDGEPKSLETLKKLKSLINKEAPHPENKMVWD